MVRTKLDTAVTHLGRLSLRRELSAFAGGGLYAVLFAFHRRETDSLKQEINGLKSRGFRVAYGDHGLRQKLNRIVRWPHLVMCFCNPNSGLLRGSYENHDHYTCGTYRKQAG